MKKLQLNKQTIVKLNEYQQNTLYGGGITLLPTDFCIPTLSICDTVSLCATININTCQPSPALHMVEHL
jgi:hypothetical protein